MITHLTVGLLGANCYIVACKKTREAVVIDPGGDAVRIASEITKKALLVRCILNTHGHWDHTGANEELRKIAHAPLLIHRLDARGLKRPPDGHLEDGQEVRFGTWTLKVLHTPGHTPGGVCLSGPGVVFTGDTLFAGSIGRTDMPGGSYESLIRSVREKLFPLGDEVRAYPGHGPATTIGTERQHNPFFR
ncbi:MAG: MBL fold metallo-hydrolase [bacterium]